MCVFVCGVFSGVFIALTVVNMSYTSAELLLLLLIRFVFATCDRPLKFFFFLEDTSLLHVSFLLVTFHAFRLSHSLSQSISSSQLVLYPLLFPFFPLSTFFCFPISAINLFRHCPSPAHFLVVKQFYKTSVGEEYVIRGNSAILKCNIPSFVADFVKVTGWTTDAGETFTPSDDYGNAWACA